MPDRYGSQPSFAARAAADAFQRAGTGKLIELGAGQGRDTLFFARSGFTVHALDFSPRACRAIEDKAAGARLSKRVSVLRHDVRTALPFGDGSFDACYSHMLFCMAFGGEELRALAAEIRRVLRAGGLFVYTARTTADPDYGSGVHYGENIYELDGFVVHFFDLQMVARLMRGFDCFDMKRFEEGALPRRLFYVALRRGESAIAAARAR